MEGVMRHFYLRALIEESMGAEADWNAIDSLMQKALAAAEKVARYRHAQLSAVKLAGDINARVPDDATLDELVAKIKSDLITIGPLLDLEVIREPSRTQGGLTVGSMSSAPGHGRPRPGTRGR
jgi:hypothetical protein